MPEKPAQIDMIADAFVDSIAISIRKLLNAYSNMGTPINPGTLFKEIEARTLEIDEEE